MLRREDTLRLSESTLQQYKESNEGYVAITTAIQEQVGREFGLNEQVGVMLLRTAESFARDDAELKEIISLSLYRRHNRCVDGSLQVGDVAPPLLHDVHLLDEQLTSVSLFDHLLSGALYDRVLRQYQLNTKSAGPRSTHLTQLRSVFGFNNIASPSESSTLSGALSSPLPLILFGGSYS